MSPPLISVVISNYNYANYLPIAIRSVQSQTITDHEIIVVDDGSTDDSRQVIESFGDRVRSVYKNNGGLASAVSAGLAEAKGRWVCLLDADDIWYPEKLSAMLDLAEKYPDAVLLGHPVEKIDASGLALGYVWPPHLPSGDISRRAARCGGHWFSPPTSGLSFRRSMLQEIGPIRDGLFPDEFLPYVLAQLGPVASTNQVLSGWRIHDDNMHHEDTGVSRQRFEKTKRRFEANETQVNAVLERMGSPRRVSLNGHWLYQLLLRRSGGKVSVVSLIRLGLFHNADPSWVRRGKAVAKNLLKIFGDDRRKLAMSTKAVAP